jgi:hypothetical protein
MLPVSVRRVVASARSWVAVALVGCRAVFWPVFLTLFLGLFLTLSLSRSARAGDFEAAAADVGSEAVDARAADAWLGRVGPSALYTGGALPGGGRGLWLGVSGGVASSPGERQRSFGLLELGVGLDAWLGAGATERSLEGENGDEPSDELGEAGRRASGLAEPRRQPLRRSLATISDPVLSEPPLSGRAAPGEASSDGAEPLSAGPEPGDSAESALVGGVRPAAGRAASLPPRSSGCEDPRSCDPALLAGVARAAVGEALRLQGGGRELRRLDGMAARSRAAASLPEVRLGAGTSRDESLRLTPTAADPARFTRDGGRDLWLEARLTWRLDSAIFAHDEIAIMRLRAQQREEAARLTGEVLEALMAWQRARLLLASDKAAPDERDAAAVRQFGAVARLDVLTDGWFSRQLERTRGSGLGAAWP